MTRREMWIREMKSAETNIRNAVAALDDEGDLWKVMNDVYGVARCMDGLHAQMAAVSTEALDRVFAEEV